MKATPIYIISLNGTANAGGVERVSYYFNEILKEKYQTKIVTAPLKNTGKLGFVLNPVLISLRLFFTPNKFVLCNSWNAFLYGADISVHHGTTYGINTHLPETVTFGTKLLAKMEQISAKKAKNVLSVSMNCSRELVQNYKINPDKIFLLNNFVDDELFIPKKTKKTAATKIIFVGSLGERKGLSNLVKLSDYLETVKGYKLLIATNTKSNTQIFENHKNTQVFTGLNINEMTEFYTKGDVLYFPTKYEGFSMSTLEALSCGIPVVGSDFAVTDELIGYKFCKRIDDFEPANVLKEADKLKNKYQNKKEEIHNSIKKRFGKDVYKKQFLEYVESLYQSV